MNLKDKTVFITGGSSGLGFSLVKAFLDKGSKIITNGTSEKSMAELKKISSTNLTMHILDIGDYKAVRQVFSQTPPIDILINNAGVWHEEMVGQLNLEKVEKIIATNLSGLIFCSNEVVPQMIKRKRGLIFNVISTSGFKARGGQAVYVASKFGARGFTDALRDELFEYQIDVVGIYPGGMSTPFFNKGGSPKSNEKWINTAELAKTIVHIAENDNSMIINDIVINRRSRGRAT